jgi:hypothetical protein
LVPSADSGAEALHRRSIVRVIRKCLQSGFF